MKFIGLFLIAILLMMIPLMILSCSATSTFSVSLSDVRHIPKLIEGTYPRENTQPYMAGWMDAGGTRFTATKTSVIVSFPDTSRSDIPLDKWLAAGMFVTGWEKSPEAGGRDQIDYGYYTILVLDPNYDGLFFEAGVYETYEALWPKYPYGDTPWANMLYNASALIGGASPSTEFALSAEWDAITGLVHWIIEWSSNRYELPSFNLTAHSSTVMRNFAMGTRYVSNLMEQGGLGWMYPFFRVYYFQFGIFSNSNIGQGGWNVLLSHPSYYMNGEWHDVWAASSICGYHAYMDFRYVWGGVRYEGVNADYDPNLPYCKVKFYYSVSTLPDYTTLKWHPADTNHDNLIDILDLVIVGVAFGSSPGYPNWDPRADVDKSGLVDIFDLCFVGGFFGIGFGQYSGIFSSSTTSAEAATLVSVYPGEVTLGKYESFSVNVTVTNATNLYGYEFKLYYNASILNCTGVTFPPNHFLKPVLNPNNIYIAKQEYNNTYNATHGRVWVAATLMNPEQPKNGSGTLATITFKALAAGTSTLKLQDVKLSNMKAEVIPITLVNGSATVHNKRYMRGDQQTINGLTAYVLGSTQSITSKSYIQKVNGLVTVYWGSRVWIRHVDGTETELTGGTPVAQVSRSSNGAGIQNGTWNCPEASLAATDAIVVRVYVKFGSGNWIKCADFTTAQLKAQKLENSTWTVYYDTQRSTGGYPPYAPYYTQGVLWWGTTYDNTHIENIQYT